jgi:ATP-dependent Clp protease ATP-binding subunit ClpX
MFRLPSERNVAKVVVDASVIRGESPPLVVYEKQNTQKAIPDD